jgi:hypothetical protein
LLALAALTALLALAALTALLALSGVGFARLRDLDP